MNVQAYLVSFVLFMWISKHPIGSKIIHDQNELKCLKAREIEHVIHDEDIGMSTETIHEGEKLRNNILPVIYTWHSVQVS